MTLDEIIVNKTSFSFFPASGLLFFFFVCLSWAYEGRHLF